MILRVVSVSARVVRVSDVLSALFAVCSVVSSRCPRASSGWCVFRSACLLVSPQSGLPGRRAWPRVAFEACVAELRNTWKVPAPAARSRESLATTGTAHWQRGVCVFADAWRGP